MPVEENLMAVRIAANALVAPVHGTLFQPNQTFGLLSIELCGHHLQVNHMTNDAVCPHQKSSPLETTRVRQFLAGH
jgi:hypothetical protein